MTETARPWTVPVTVAEIPDGGAHYELAANEAERSEIARATGLRHVSRLTATFDLTRRGDGVAVRGEVRAHVGQSCVVTLEPIDGEILENVDLVFAPSIDIEEV